MIPELPKKGGATMCAVLDRVENRGRNAGRQEGKVEGRSEGISIGTLIGKVSVYYNDMGLSPEQIADKVNKPLGEVLNIIQKLKSADKSD